MKQFDQKFKLIFLPFLIITAATVCVYTFLHWLLFITTDKFRVDEEVLNLFVPLILPWIPILIWLRPRLKLLDLKSQKKGDPLTGFMLFAWMAMVAPNVIAQEYLITATGKLTSLDKMSQIDQLTKTKYYKVKNFYIDKKLAKFKSRFVVSGKYNSDFDMYIYGVVPVYDTNYTVKTYHFKISSPHSTINSNNALIVLNGKTISKDSLSYLNPRSIKKITILKGASAMAIYGQAAKNGVIVILSTTAKVADTLQALYDDDMHHRASAWVGIRYLKTISNRFSVSEKNEKYHAFAETCLSSFRSEKLENFIYLDRVPQGKDLENYIAATKLGDLETDYSPNILKTVYEPFEARNGQKLPWIFGSFAIGALIFLITLLFKPLNVKTDLENSNEEIIEKQSLVESVKQIFVPREGFYITPLIIDLNLIIFLVMCCSGLGFVSFSSADLLKLGANFRPLVIKGEYWRLLTNIFLHGGLMHVLFNMYALLFVGIFLEPVMGKNKFTAAYFITGIIASIASIWWHPATVSIGASGAIFGMYGVFLALLITNLFPKEFRKSFLINTLIFVGYNLAFGLTGGIDNAAHIGGLLSGFILGCLMYPAIKDGVKQLAAEKQIEQSIEGLNRK